MCGFMVRKSIAKRKTRVEKMKVAEQKLHKICAPFEYAIGGAYVIREKYGLRLRRPTIDIDFGFEFNLLLSNTEKEKICKRFANYGIKLCEKDKEGKLWLKKKIIVEGVDVHVSSYKKDEAMEQKMIELKKKGLKNVLPLEDIVLGKIVRWDKDKDQTDLAEIWANHRYILDKRYLEERIEEYALDIFKYKDIISRLDRLERGF